MQEKGIALGIATMLAVGGSVAADAKGGRWIDVLAIAKSRNTPFGGSWKTGEAEIIAKAASGGRLEIPLEIAGSYELTVSLLRLSGKGFYGIRFPVGSRSLALSLSANGGREDLLDGTWRSEGTGKTSATPSIIKVKGSKRHDIRIEVRQRGNLAKVTVTADGKDHLSWQGDTRKICPEEIWGDTGAKTLSLGLWNGSIRLEALKVRVISGKHRVIKSRRGPKITRFDRKKLPQGQGVGGADGTPFRDAPDQDALLVGVSFRYSAKAGLVTLVPIFRTKDGIVYGQRRGGRQYPDELAQTLLAREGFAVGGIIANRGTQRPIAGIKAVFMRVEGRRLDPTKSYESRGYGARSGGRARFLGGDGRAVIGIEGKSGSIVEQLSLVLR
jgi:hypothetical protein